MAMNRNVWSTTAKAESLELSPPRGLPSPTIVYRGSLGGSLDVRRGVTYATEFGREFYVEYGLRNTTLSGPSLIRRQTAI